MDYAEFGHGDLQSAERSMDCRGLLLPFNSSLFSLPVTFGDV